jgi:pimeloyl-ACP methyl ester carboxylesterase
VGVTRDGYRTVFTDRFADLSVPTYLLHGAHDELFPVAWARRASERIPDAELRVLDDCGHWPPRERPDAVAESIDAAISGD